MTFPDFFAHAQETVAKPLQNLVTQLSDRWTDEAEYEDIKNYEAAIRKALPEGVGFVKMHKRPFGFTFTQSGHSFRLTCGSRAYSLTHLGSVSQPTSKPAPEPAAPVPAQPQERSEEPDPEYPTEEPDEAATEPNYVVCCSADDGTFAELLVLDEAGTSKRARKLAAIEAKKLGWPADLIFNAQQLEP